MANVGVLTMLQEVKNQCQWELKQYGSFMTRELTAVAERNAESEVTIDPKTVIQTVNIDKPKVIIGSTESEFSPVNVVKATNSQKSPLNPPLAKVEVDAERIDEMSSG